MCVSLKGDAEAVKFNMEAFLVAESKAAEMAEELIRDEEEQASKAKGKQSKKKKKKVKGKGSIQAAQVELPLTFIFN